MGERGQSPSLYAVLDVASDATFEQIESAYRRKADSLEGYALATYSIDGADDVDERREQLTAAYRTLSDPDRRAQYDKLTRSDTTYPSVLVDRAAGDTSSSGDVARARHGQATPARASVPTDAPKRDTPAPRPSGRSGTRKLVVTVELKKDEDYEVSGSLLRRLRESASASIDEVADITKISKRYLVAIEENDYDMLPASVYVRGFVAEYARVLGLDPKRSARSYMALYERYKSKDGT